MTMLFPGKTTDLKVPVCQAFATTMRQRGDRINKTGTRATQNGHKNSHKCDFK
jgi:hypothetical protein